MNAVDVGRAVGVDVAAAAAAADDDADADDGVGCAAAAATADGACGERRAVEPGQIRAARVRGGQYRRCHQR